MDLDGRDWYYYSDASSESSSEERYINDWEREINVDGSLFFVKHYPQKDDVKEEYKNTLVNQTNPCDKPTGILGRFMRRRNSRRSLRRTDNKISSKKDAVTEQERNLAEDNKEKEPEDNQIFSRIIIDYNSVSVVSLESLFGLKTVNISSAVIITGFLPNKVSSFDSRVSIGDRLYSVNGTLITSRNLDEVLLGLGNCKEVLLGFHKINKDTVERKLSNSLLSPATTNEKGVSTGYGSVVYAKYDGLTEGGPPDQGIMYCFPKKGNILAQIRGAFFTLSHLLSTVSQSPPRSTTMKMGNDNFNVLYVHEKSELLLISFPNTKYFLEESIRIVSSVARCLEFMFQSLTRCFSSQQNVDFLDSFFHKLLYRTKVDDIENYPTWEFETLLPAPCSFHLPKDIFMQIDDALNELESNYIPSQEGRLFTIIGSCYFYKGYMISNHLSNKDLLDVAALMKETEILKLCKGGVKDLVYWREVYPLSCQRGMTLLCSAPYSTPVGRWFLLIVGMDHSFLATVFEAGGCTVRAQINKGPVVAYVEEAQATLRHIMKTGFPISFNKLLNVNSECTEDFREQTKSASTDSSSSISSYAELQIQNKHLATEVHRPLNLSGFRGRQSAEPIRLLSSYAEVEYGSEEEFVPVLGRRAERELALETNSQSRISVSDSVSDDSDWLKDYKSTNRNFAIDMNDLNKSISVEDYIASPRSLVEDENLIIHFINFEASEGILISSIMKPEKSSKYLEILQTFRQHAHKIQKIFLTTILFKKLKSQEKIDVLNKSLVAVNEYGTLFQYADDAKGVTESYWVVGKLFFMPHPREVYVCFFDSCPQSMIEIAFQLALSSVR